MTDERRKRSQARPRRKTSSAEERSRRALVRAIRPTLEALGLTEDDVVHRAVFMPCRAGREIILPNDAPEFLYVVGGGAVLTTVRVSDRRRFIVQIAKPGQVVGLAPIGSAHGAARFGAVALRDSVVLVIARELAREVLDRQPPSSRLAIAAYQARALSRLIVEVCRLFPYRLVRDRLRIRLPVIARAFPGPGSPYGIDPLLRLTQQHFAELVASSRAPVNRALRGGLPGGIPERELPAGADDDGDADHAPLSTGGRESHRRTFLSSLTWAQNRMGLPAHAARALGHHAILRVYAPGEPIRVADRLCATVLVRGAAAVYCAVAEAADVGAWIARPGHFIGAGWLGTASTAPAVFRAVAYAPSLVAVVPQQLIENVLAGLTGDQLLYFLGYCHQVLCRHLHTKALLLNLPVRDALEHQLRELAIDFARTDDRGTIIDLDLANERDAAPRMLSRFIGATPTSVSKAFTSLKKAGRVAVADGRILLPGFHVTGRSA